MNQIKVLVLGAGAPSGVNFIKSLLLKNIICYGTDSNKYHIHLAQPYTHQTFLVPRCTHADYINSINRIIENNDIDFVHPQSSVQVKVISENRNKIKCKIFLPKKETIEICQDKMASALIWWTNGLCKEPISIDIRAGLVKQEIKYALDKYNKIWLRATEGAGGRGSTPVENVETGYHWIRYWRSKDWQKNSFWEQWEWMAQPYLPGRNIAWHSLWKDGKLIISQAREHLEYIYPYLAPSGITGTPVVQRTLNEGKINLIAESSVLAIDKKPNGIFCVDLKEDKDGKPIPTEINAGRFFTTSFFFSELGRQCGIERANMPYLYLLLGLDREIPKGNKYNILPDNIYWIRHIDIPAKIIYGDDL